MLGGGGTPYNYFNAVNTYRRARWCYLHHLEPVAWLMRGWIYFAHNSFVPYKADIGKGTIFGYKGIGLVIHSDAVIGENCRIGTGVTIGGRSGLPGVPSIGNNVSIGNGAKVLGPIHVGNDAEIGANAVVITDVPDRAVVAGVPSRIIRIKEEGDGGSQ